MWVVLSAYPHVVSGQLHGHAAQSPCFMQEGAWQLGSLTMTWQHRGREGIHKLMQTPYRAYRLQCTMWSECLCATRKQVSYSHIEFNTLSAADRSRGWRIFACTYTWPWPVKHQSEHVCVRFMSPLKLLMLNCLLDVLWIMKKSVPTFSLSMLSTILSLTC